MGAAAAPAKAVFALLVTACFGAFFVTQRLKHSPTLVQRFMMAPFFSPTPTGHNKTESVSFRIERSGDVNVTIVDSEGRYVATLAGDRPLQRYTQLPLTWNGREGPAQSGAPAPEGHYRVRVAVAHDGRPVTSLRSFKLVRVPQTQG